MFGDRREKYGIIQFSQHKLDVTVADDLTMDLKPEELVLGSTATRKLNIQNPANSTPCVLRIWFEFCVDGKINEEYLTFSVDSENFSVNDNNRYYYNAVLASNGKIENLVLNFKVHDNISKEYEGKKYSLKLYIESIQANKEAVGEWKDDYKPEWYDKVKAGLN